MKIMWIWVPDDQEKWGPSRCIAIDSRPKQPGLVYEVVAKSAEAGADKVRMATGPQPVEEEDPTGWLAWRIANRDVKPVIYDDQEDSSD